MQSFGAADFLTGREGAGQGPLPPLVDRGKERSAARTLQLYKRSKKQEEDDEEDDKAEEEAEEKEEDDKRNRKRTTRRTIKRRRKRKRRRRMMKGRERGGSGTITEDGRISMTRSSKEGPSGDKDMRKRGR